MYIITVIFYVYKSNVEEFALLVAKQASDSLEKEKECLIFDVSIGEENNGIIPFFLYEVYSDKKSFDTHLNMDYFHEFSNKVSGIVANKTVNSWNKIN
tara:strand:- start:203 stop:496 length:294 start_codon:yes stop_codon:yes gene_type:complete